MKYDLLSQFSKVFNRIILHFIFSYMQIIAFLLYIALYKNNLFACIILIL
jgi:hypothetical protein